jgi:hypothetical protein
MKTPRHHHLDVCSEAVEALFSVPVPKHLRGGLQRYLEDGIEPGSFLLACIEDKFSEALSRSESLEDLKAVGRWLQLHAPALAWGSVEKRVAWQVRAKRSLEAPEATP